MTLNAPNLYINMLGTTRPMALAPFRTAILGLVGEWSVTKGERGTYSIKSKTRFDSVFYGVELQEEDGIEQSRDRRGGSWLKVRNCLLD